METNVEKNKRIAAQVPINLIVNVASFMLSFVISLSIIPYFRMSLGDAYGIIGLATSVTLYVVLVVMSLNLAVSRFLTINLQKEDYKSANITFNTAIIGVSALIVLMIPVILLVAFIIPYIFPVPPGVQANDVTVLFLGVFASFLITMWTGNFTMQLFAMNRIDLQVIVNATIFLTQNGLIVLFFYLYHPGLVYIGIAYPVGAICASILAIMFARRVCPRLKLSVSSFDFSQLKTLFGMCSWSIIDQLGNLLFLQIDLIIVTLLFSSSIATQYYMVLCISAIIRSIAVTVSGVLVPVVYTYYARNQIEMLVKIVDSAVKVMGIFMALPVGLLCGLSTTILMVWLHKGIDTTYFAPLLVLLAFPLTINMSILPLFAINYAYNKIKVPGIATLALGAGNFALAIILPLVMIYVFHLSDIAFYGVAVAGGIMLTLRNAVFITWYAGKIMDIKPTIFLKSLMTGVVCTILVAMTSFAVSQLVTITSFAMLIPIGGTIGLVYMLLAWKFALSPIERGQFKNVMPPFIWRLLERVPQ